MSTYFEGIQLALKELRQQETFLVLAEKRANIEKVHQALLSS